MAANKGNIIITYLKKIYLRKDEVYSSLKFCKVKVNVNLAKVWATRFLLSENWLQVMLFYL